MTAATRLACGIKDVASAQKETFTTTQAVWRFLNNEKISFSKLNQPILELATREIKQSAHTYALMIHDWSHLTFVTHKSKKKILKMSHHGDLGYELQSSLLVDAANGLPIVPISQSLTDNETRHSTLGDKLKAQETHMDALTEDIKDIEELNLGKILVHIIDREGDSIAHMRELSSHGYNFLIRGKGQHTVEYQGKNQKLNDVADSLLYNNTVTINYKGKKAYLSVSETTITLSRMAKPKRFSDEGKRISPQLGKPLPLRLVVSKVSDKKGNVLARWMLLSNVLEEITGEELARWYYWRWTIESFFKLIKSAGHNVESWLQKSAKALLRRLIIASMACVLVWRIQRAEGIQNAKARKFLCRLSGRPQKRGRRESAPAILAGLSVLLNTIQLLSEYSAEELSKFTSTILGSTKYV